MLVAGGAIGAGMFSLPVVSAGMWFPWAIVSLFTVWLVSYLAALLLMETNLLYPPGASFDTFVTDTLGKAWNTATGLSIAFVLYILLYAYFSAGGSIVNHTLDSVFSLSTEFSPRAMSLLFGFTLASIVWIGTALVSRLSVILLGGMVITFLISNSGLMLHVEAVKLFNTNTAESNYFPYLWAALPYFLTSFGCASLVPSLIKFYGNEPVKIRNCLLYGSLLSLVVYLIWVFVVFGNVSRIDFIPVIEAGGNMGNLIAALESSESNETMNYLLNLFSNFAIISSFFGVGLSLFDYLADMFKFGNHAQGRFKTACVTFLPPAIFSFFFPHGFILAIGYAGLGLFFGYFLVPVLMAWRNRKRFPDMEYQLCGGATLVHAILGFSGVIATCKILTIFGLLKVYP